MNDPTTDADDAPLRPRLQAMVVEDVAEDREFLAEVLRREGFDVTACATGTEATELARRGSFDILILDLGLPDESGFEVLVRVRRDLSVPVIVVTGQADVETAIVGLRLGADDHVVKPVPPALLAARVNALVRRSRTPEPRTAKMRFDGLEIDAKARAVRVDGAPIAMPAREFDLLVHLASNPRQVWSREQLLNDVWGSYERSQDPSTVTEHIRRLRQRIERDPNTPRWIITVRGAGYRFDP